MKQTIKEQKKRYPCFNCVHLAKAKIFTSNDTRPRIQCNKHQNDYALDHCLKQTNPDLDTYYYDLYKEWKINAIFYMVLFVLMGIVLFMHHYNLL